MAENCNQQNKKLTIAEFRIILVGDSVGRLIIGIREYFEICDLEKKRFNRKKAKLKFKLWLFQVLQKC